MSETRKPVLLREVAETDIEVFFEQQLDPDATRMAAFPARDKEAHVAHWNKVLGDPSTVTRTIIVGDRVAGYMGSWEQGDEREVGYWIGKEYWGKGIATAALSHFLEVVNTRPLYANVAEHNVASIRVLEKCGFTVAHRSIEDVPLLVMVLAV
jgi:RimJ/RimL family protein N-acetyltransferase